MKVSGAVAMADDPGHAFGIYFEKIAAGGVGKKIESIPFDAPGSELIELLEDGRKAIEQVTGIKSTLLAP